MWSFFSQVWLKSPHLHVNHISLSFDLSRGGELAVIITLLFLFLLKDNASSLVQISDSNRLKFLREKCLSINSTWNRHYFISEPRGYLKSNICNISRIKSNCLPTPPPAPRHHLTLQCNLCSWISILTSRPFSV